MKSDIIIIYTQRYELDHEKDFVPPITGIHLAAITPAKHEVRVFHQQVDKIDYNTNADQIAISFFSVFAMAAFNSFYRYKKNQIKSPRRYEQKNGYIQDQSKKIL